MTNVKGVMDKIDSEIKTEVKTNEASCDALMNQIK